MVVAVVPVAAEFTVSVTLVLPEQPFWAVAVTVKLKVPGTVGMPESVPVLGFMLKPAGKVPLVVHVNVAVSRGMNDCEKGVPTVALGSSAPDGKTGNAVQAVTIT